MRQILRCPRCGGLQEGSYGATVQAMIDVVPISESEMVLAFLRSEIDSPRFQGACIAALRYLNTTREALIDNADLSDVNQNQQRAFVLSCGRGYGRGALLFMGFPPDVAWRRCTADIVEMADLRYANYETLRQLSGGTRLVRDGAMRALDGTLPLSEEVRTMIEGIHVVVAGVHAGRQYPEIIGLQQEGSPQVVLLEGHTRATAYVIAGAPQTVSVLIGTSAQMRHWWLF